MLLILGAESEGFHAMNSLQQPAMDGTILRSGSGLCNVQNRRTHLLGLDS